MAKSKGKEFTPRQVAFIAHYLMTLNASEAARRAGYAKKSANVEGVRLLSNANIKAEIEKRIAADAMSAGEVLKRLSDMARASLDDVMDADDEFGLKLARATGKIQLVKKYKLTTRTDEDGNTIRTTEIELHDAQAALVHLGKYHKLFSTQIEITIYDSLASKLGVTPAEARAIAGRIAKGEITIEDVMTGNVKVKADVSND